MTQSNASSAPRIVCIINPKAANRKWERNILIRNYLQKHLPGKFVDTHEDKEFTVQKTAELCADHDIIVAAGGDGTIADVLQGIVLSGRGQDLALGILPLGSGNAFRISLGIPLHLPRALRIIQEGFTREIDLIDFGGRVGTFGSLGATARVTWEAERHWMPGFFGHLLAGRIMSRLSRQEQEIELFDGFADDGIHFEHTVLNLNVFDVIIGKSSHFGYGWKMAPQAKINDGYIDLTFFEVSGSKFLWSFPSIYFGKFQKTQRHYKATRAIIKGKNLPVQYNGELLGKRDVVELKILPRALKIISPRNFTP
ncbi:MAG: diacylglycerol kinase family protein [Candidatus Aminicenantaceae bacterium]